ILYSSLIHPPPTSTLFPYTTLFRSGDAFTVDQLAWGAVWSEIRQRVRREPRYAHCDPRLRDAVEREGVTELEGLAAIFAGPSSRSEEHTSELQSLTNLVCRLLLETQ